MYPTDSLGLRRSPVMDFRALHYGVKPLLLPNAWDVGSAVAFADQGFPAIGTTSFGVGAAAGYADGARASKAQTVRLVRAMSALSAYVSADIEDGYSDEPGEVAEYVASLGADGVNIEDSTGEALVRPDRHAAKIAEIKRQVPGVFVNARVDNYWLGQDAGVLAVLERADAYVMAGADGIFVPGVTSAFELETLAAAIPVPLNVLVVPLLTLEDLGGLGVRRVSTGSLPYRAAVDAAVGVALAVRDGRTPPTATPYPEAQARMSKYASQVTRESTTAPTETVQARD
jgi:2-methylisocitrate lyase-like PEP mutase family enzyme